MEGKKRGIDCTAGKRGMLWGAVTSAGGWRLAAPVLVWSRLGRLGSLAFSILVWTPLLIQHLLPQWPTFLSWIRVAAGAASTFKKSKLLKWRFYILTPLRLNLRPRLVFPVSQCLVRPKHGGIEQSSIRPKLRGNCFDNPLFATAKESPRQLALGHAQCRKYVE